MKTASTFRSPSTSDLQWQSLNFLAFYYNNGGILSVKYNHKFGSYFSYKGVRFSDVSQKLNMVSSAQNPKKDYLSFHFFFAFSSCQDE